MVRKTLNQRGTKRKYQPLWEQMKAGETITLRLMTELTPKQAEAQYRTIRKALSKEKYMDAEFRIKYPQAVLDTYLSQANYTIQARVILDPYGISLFE